MHFEIALGLEYLSETANIGAHIRRRHFGQLARNQSPLCRIVVDKHDAIKANIELCGDLADVFRFRIPVCFECAEILELQDAVGMREAFLCIFDVVLRTHSQDDAAPLQVLYILLKIQESLADWMVATQNQVLHAIVANDPAPKCVVQVEDETFLGSFRKQISRARQRFAPEQSFPSDSPPYESCTNKCALPLVQA